MKIITTDNNAFLEDGSANPNYGQATEVEVPDPVQVPKLLSKTAFRKYAASQLGSGTTGMGRLEDIIDAAAASTGAVKFCYRQYGAADTFEKSEVDAFSSFMVAAGIMTAGERTAILDNWPVS